MAGAQGDGWESERSRKAHDGARLDTRKDCDGVRIGGVCERLGVGPGEARGAASRGGCWSPGRRFQKPVAAEVTRLILQFRIPHSDFRIEVSLTSAATVLRSAPGGLPFGAGLARAAPAVGDSEWLSIEG